MRIIAILFLCTVVNTYTGGDDLVSLGSIKEYQKALQFERIADGLMHYTNTPERLESAHEKYAGVIVACKKLLEDGYVQCGADITRVIGKMNPERSGNSWTKFRIEIYKKMTEIDVGRHTRLKEKKEDEDDYASLMRDIDKVRLEMQGACNDGGDCSILT